MFEKVGIVVDGRGFVLHEDEPIRFFQREHPRHAEVLVGVRSVKTGMVHVCLWINEMEKWAFPLGKYDPAVGPDEDLKLQVAINVDLEQRHKHISRSVEAEMDHLRAQRLEDEAEAVEHEEQVRFAQRTSRSIEAGDNMERLVIVP